MNTSTLFDLDQFSKTSQTVVGDWDNDVAVEELPKRGKKPPAPPSPKKHDSLTPLGVIESLVLTPLIDSLTHLLPVSESTPECPSDEPTAINIYTPRGKARADYQYFRYSYRDGSRIRHCHIPGGNIHSALAQSRRDQLEEMVRQGRSPSEIVQMIQSWGRKQS